MLLHYRLASGPVDVPVLLAGTSSAAIDLGGNLPSSDPVGGAVQVSVSSGAGVIGSIWIRTDDYRTMAALSLESGGATSYVFPQLAQAQGYWTGMAITNPGSAACDVTIEALDSNGAAVGNYPIKNLQPGETKVGLIYQWIPATLGMSSGSVRVVAASPVLAAEIFGNDSLTLMASVPGK